MAIEVISASDKISEIYLNSTVAEEDLDPIFSNNYYKNNFPSLENESNISITDASNVNAANLNTSVVYQNSLSDVQDINTLATVTKVTCGISETSLKTNGVVILPVANVVDPLIILQVAQIGVLNSDAPYVGETLVITQPLSFAGGNGEDYLVSFVWYANGAPIDGAIASSYILSNNEVGAEIVLEITVVSGSDTIHSITNTIGPVIGF